MSDHQTPSEHLRKWLITGLGALIAVLLLIGFLPRIWQNQRLDEAAAESRIPSVRIVVAEPNDKPAELTLPSSTQAHHITPIWARTNGYLVKLNADIGDNVKEGQVLAVLDTPEVDQQYMQAVADLANTKANREIAKISAERWQELYKVNPEAISKQEVDERVATYTASEAQVLAGEANVNRLKQLQDFKYIEAPFEGVITQRNIDLGSLITAGSSGTPQQLFEIAKVDWIRNFVYVPQIYFRAIKEGVEAQVHVREFPERTFKGIVTRYAKALDPVSRTLLTEVDIDNKDRIIYPGLYTEVTFFVKPDAPYFVVPGTAIIIRTGAPKMAVLDENNVVHLRDVDIGRDYGKAVEILKGLKKGDRIVVNPSEKIKDGVKVEISEQAAPPTTPGAPAAAPAPSSTNSKETTVQPKN